MECSGLNTPIYTRLCFALSLPTNGQKGQNNSKAFTGNPQVDMEILRRMSDEDLISVCLVNKYVNGLCNRESFWINKVINKYGAVLGSGVAIKKNYLNNGEISWKDYYLWLSDVLNSPLPVRDHIAYFDNRDDIRKLIGGRTLCSDMDPGKYQDLYQMLSKPLKFDLKAPRPFTGNPTTDMEILKKLSDEDLVNVCRVNKYTFDLCNNECFWADKLQEKFPQLGSREEIRQKYVKGMGWKNYYLWLSDLFGDYDHMTYQTPQGTEYSRNLSTPTVRELSKVYLKAGYEFLDTGREDLKTLLGGEWKSVSTRDHPIKLTPEMRDFIRAGNFGLADPNNPVSGPLQNYLSAPINGITTRTIMNAIFHIYLRKNDLLTQRPFLYADAEMYRYLGGTFEKLSSRPPKTTKEGERIPPFNPERFRYTDLQNIIADNIVPEDQLTEQDRDIMSSYETRCKLGLEYKLVCDIISYNYLR